MNNSDSAMRILDWVRDGPVKSELYERMLPVIEELHDQHQKNAKRLPDDPNF